MSAAVLHFPSTPPVGRKIALLRTTRPAAVAELEALVDYRFPHLAWSPARRAQTLEGKLGRLAATHPEAVRSLEQVIDLLNRRGRR